MAIIDKPLDYFIIQEDEVEQIKWFAKKELIAELNKNPENFIAAIKENVEKFN